MEVIALYTLDLISFVLCTLYFVLFGVMSGCQDVSMRREWYISWLKQSRVTDLTTRSIGLESESLGG